jgi:hypothetical protein
MQEVRSSNLLSSTLGVFSQLRSLVSARTGSACRTDQARPPMGCCAVCAGHGHLRSRWRPLAYPSSEPGCVALRASRRSRSSGTALRSAPWRTASPPASDGSHPEHAATSPEVPALFCTSAQVPVRRPAGRGGRLPSPGRCRIPGDLLSWRSSEVTAGCLGRDEALTRGRSCRSLPVAQIVPGRFPGIRPSVSD